MDYITSVDLHHHHHSDYHCPPIFRHLRESSVERARSAEVNPSITFPSSSLWTRWRRRWWWWWWWRWRWWWWWWWSRSECKRNKWELTWEVGWLATTGSSGLAESDAIAPWYMVAITRAFCSCQTIYGKPTVQEMDKDFSRHSKDSFRIIENHKEWFLPEIVETGGDPVRCRSRSGDLECSGCDRTESARSSSPNTWTYMKCTQSPFDRILTLGFASSRR